MRSGYIGSRRLSLERESDGEIIGKELARPERMPGEDDGVSATRCRGPLARRLWERIYALLTPTGTGGCRPRIRHAGLASHHERKKQAIARRATTFSGVHARRGRARPLEISTGWEIRDQRREAKRGTWRSGLRARRGVVKMALCTLIPAHSSSQRSCFSSYNAASRWSFWKESQSARFTADASRRDEGQWGGANGPVL